jgi:hypothetical protein
MAEVGHSVDPRPAHDLALRAGVVCRARRLIDQLPAQPLVEQLGVMVLDQTSTLKKSQAVSESQCAFMNCFYVRSFSRSGAG